MSCRGESLVMSYVSSFSIRQYVNSLGILTFNFGSTPIDIYPLQNTHHLIRTPWLKPSLVFKTPILQISSSPLITSPASPSLLAVRNFGTVSLVQTKKPKDAQDPFALVARVIHTQAMPSEPLHVALNPVLRDEAAIVCQDGSIYKWHFERPKDMTSRYII